MRLASSGVMSSSSGGLSWWCDMYSARWSKVAQGQRFQVQIQSLDGSLDADGSPKFFKPRWEKQCRQAWPNVGESAALEDRAAGFRAVARRVLLSEHASHLGIESNLLHTSPISSRCLDAGPQPEPHDSLNRRQSWPQCHLVEGAARLPANRSALTRRHRNNASRTR